MAQLSENDKNSQAAEDTEYNAAELQLWEWWDWEPLQRRPHAVQRPREPQSFCLPRFPLHVLFVLALLQESFDFTSLSSSGNESLGMRCVSSIRIQCHTTTLPRVSATNPMATASRMRQFTFRAAFPLPSNGAFSRTPRQKRRTGFDGSSTRDSSYDNASKPRNSTRLPGQS